MRFLKRILEKTIDFSGMLSALMIAFLAVAIIYEIGMRYFLDRPPHWVFEITQITLLYLTFLGAAWVQRADKHVSIDVVLIFLSRRKRALLNTLTSSLCIIISLIMTWYGAVATVEQVRLNLHPETVVPVPGWVFVVVIPIGGFFLTLESIRRTFRYFQEWRTS